MARTDLLVTAVPYVDRAGIRSDGGPHHRRRHGGFCDGLDEYVTTSADCARNEPARRCQCRDRFGRGCCARMDAEDLLCAACRSWCPAVPVEIFPGAPRG